MQECIALNTHVSVGTQKFNFLSFQPKQMLKLIVYNFTLKKLFIFEKVSTQWACWITMTIFKVDICPD